MLKMYYLYSVYAAQFLFFVLLCVIDHSIQVTVTKSLEISRPLSSQSYDFSSSHVWMWELDHKKKKKTECQRIDAFELWCWRRFLRVPWTARRPNQSILKEISPEYSLEGLMLKLHYFGHLMRRTDSFEKTQMVGKLEGGRRRGWQDEMVGRSHWLSGHEFE